MPGPLFGLSEGCEGPSGLNPMPCTSESNSDSLSFELVIRIPIIYAFFKMDNLILEGLVQRYFKSLVISGLTYIFCESLECSLFDRSPNYISLFD